MILLSILGLAFLWSLPAVQASEFFVVSATYGDYSLMPYVSDPLGRLFATIFLMVLITGSLYAWSLDDRGESLGTMLYGAGAVGVVLAGDYLTLFIFWELMAIASTWLIWSRREVGSTAVGVRYLIYHLMGGGFLLMGILFQIQSTGSIQLQPFTEGISWGTLGQDVVSNPSSTLGPLFLLLGVAVNAAVVPLHAWLPDAYAKASWTGSVFMSALTTKSAIYVMIRLFPGLDILLLAGLVMAVFGTIYGLLSNDVRQILSYSIIAQLGYMMAAVGVGSEMALNGAAAHAFSHILYKSLLFMCAGAMAVYAGRATLVEWEGSSRDGAGRDGTGRDHASRDSQQWKQPDHALPWGLFALYMIGALSISGVPLLSGFISKPMILESLGKAHHEAGLLILIAASIGTFLHTGLKIPYAMWIKPRLDASSHLIDDATQSDDVEEETSQDVEALQKHKLPLSQWLAMSLGAGLCLLFGLAPELLYGWLPYPVKFSPFEAYPISESLMTLSGGFFAFVLLRKWLYRPGTVLDLDWMYQKGGQPLRKVVVDTSWSVFGAVDTVVQRMASSMTQWFRGEEGTGPTPAQRFHLAQPSIESAIAWIVGTMLVVGLALLL
jgi:multicomponent Na+:H+ antiporter subunit D